MRRVAARTMATKDTSVKSVNPNRMGRAINQTPDDEKNQNEEEWTAEIADVADDDFVRAVLSQRKNMLQRVAPKDPDEMALKDGVPRKIIIQWIAKELREETACKSIPFIIGLLIVFVVMVNSHLAQEDVRGVQQSITNFLQQSASFGFVGSDRNMGHKGIQDIYSFADLYSWINLGFLPALHTAAFQVSENIASDVGNIKVQHRNFNSQSPATGEFLTFNTIIGGVRFHQSRAQKSECRLPENFEGEITAPCFGSELYLTQPEAVDSMPLMADEAVGEEYFLLSNPLSSWLEKTKDLELGCQTREANGETCQCATCGDHPWIDPSTLQVQLAFISLNREMGLWSEVNVNFFLNRGGRIWQSISVDSQWVHPYDRSGMQLAIQEVVWFLMNMVILGQEVREIRREMREAGGLRHIPRRLFHYFQDPWNLIDWVTITISLTILGLWITHLARSSKLRNDFPVKYTTFDSNTQLANFFAAVEQVFILDFYVRGLFSVYAIVIMCRLFKGYSAQPRLALVTRTLERAGLDLVHFLFVFLTIFFAFGAAGLALFGREMDEFSTFSSSVNTLYRILLGDFMWDKMQSVGIMQAALFFWLYTIIVVLIMLNMLLAVILETYSNVKQQVGNAETLWSQVVESTVRWYEKRRKVRVGLQFVCECLVNEALTGTALYTEDNLETGGDSSEDAKSQNKQSFSTRRNMAVENANTDRSLKLDELMNLVPGIKVAEASEILQKSLNDHLFIFQHSHMDALQEMESLEDVVTTLSTTQMLIRANLLRAINRVDDNVKALHRDFRKFKDGCKLQASPDTPWTNPEGIAPSRIVLNFSESGPSKQYGGDGDDHIGQVASETYIDPPAFLAAQRRSDVEKRLDLVERSFGTIMDRLNAMDRIPERIHDLISPVDIEEVERNAPSGCVPIVLASCQPRQHVEAVSEIRTRATIPRP